MASCSIVSLACNAVSTASGGRREVVTLDEGVRRRLREHRPAPAKPFAWLDGSQTTNVFVPVLFGAGFVLSGLAWIVDRVARATAGQAVEHGLARSLTALQPPPGGLLGGDGRHDPYHPR